MAARQPPRPSGSPDGPAPAKGFDRFGQEGGRFTLDGGAEAGLGADATPEEKRAARKPPPRRPAEKRAAAEAAKAEKRSAAEAAKAQAAAELASIPLPPAKSLADVRAGYAQVETLLAKSKALVATGGLDALLLEVGKLGDVVVAVERESGLAQKELERAAEMAGSAKEAMARARADLLARVSTAGDGAAGKITSDDKALYRAAQADLRQAEKDVLAASKRVDKAAARAKEAAAKAKETLASAEGYMRSSRDVDEWLRYRSKGKSGGPGRGTWGEAWRPSRRTMPSSRLRRA